MGHKHLALTAACLIAVIALVATLASARAMAAPPPPPSTANSGASPSGTFVCFYRDHTPACATRAESHAVGSTGEQARVLLQALVAGPSAGEQASGLRSALPLDAQLVDVIVESDAITVTLVLPEPFLYGELDALQSDEINEQVVKTLYPIESLRKFHVLALDPRDPAGAFKPISYFLFEPPPVHKEEGQVTPLGRPSQAAALAGALSGKAVYLSAGHGWYWNEGYSRWDTQRYANGGYKIIEDMNNAEVVNQYLVQYLQNAGADVWPVREQDMNTQEIIITHNQPAYSESGTWATSSTNVGYQGIAYRYAVVTATATATATWTFTPATSGRYAVYAWYKPSANRAPDAQYLVVHDGGVTEARVDQRIHGAAWRYIGTFPFAANAPGQVMLTNLSSTTDSAVIADAIRVGGGMGTETGDGPPPSPGASGKPRWEEAARYWAEYQGAPPEVYMPCPAASGDDCDDVTARPLYAEWERSSSEDAVFVSWHTNASGVGARGTESYIYDGAWGGTFTPDSDQLQYWIQTTLINDIRAGWESDWIDRGLRQANFGEVRALATMPGTLVEIAFHDQQQDADALKDPRFAQLTARAMYKGIVRFFAAKDDTSPVILPEPPRNLIVRNSGPGQVTVSWRPSPTDTTGLLGDAATGYRVYTSNDGFGWDNGTPVIGTSFRLSGLASNQLVFVRATATNAGGESLSTPVAAARVADAGSAPVLIVYGYERIDQWMDIERCDQPTSANCPNVRIWPEQMNNLGYVVQHATAISLPLDSAMRAAVDSGDIVLDNYGMVDWIAGQEQTPAPIPNGVSKVALTNAEQAALAEFLSSGHALFISGAEVAYDLASNLNAPSYLRNTLRAQFAQDNANTFSVSASAGGIFAGLSSFSFDDGSHGTYLVSYPDVLTPTNGSASALSYTGGTGGAAAIQYANGCQRLVYLGFPFETIYPASTRQAVMSRVMGFLSACAEVAPSATIHSPGNSGFYNKQPAINGAAGGWTPADHVDVAMLDVANSRFLSGTSWTPTQTWMSAAGSATWAFTPSVSLADGPYAVWARAWTTKGLSSTQIAMVTFTMDTISPTTPGIITPTGGITLTSINIMLVFSPSTDANGVAGYTVEVDDKLYTATATYYLATGLQVGAHTWAVRAFDTAGNASDWATATFTANVFRIYLPVVLRDYTQSFVQCHELVANGGFETQDVWYSLSAVKPVHVTNPTHNGLSSLLIGYTTTDGTPISAVYSSIQQTITIPTTASKTTLTFWRYPVSGDLAGDYAYLGISRSPTATFTIVQYRSNEQAWVPATYDLSTYTGTIYIRFGVKNDGQNSVTAMYLDDVSAQSCSP